MHQSIVGVPEFGLERLSLVAPQHPPPPEPPVLDYLLQIIERYATKRIGSIRPVRSIRSIEPQTRRRRQGSSGFQ